jgi:flagellar hook-length control protein FliK
LSTTDDTSVSASAESLATPSAPAIPTATQWTAPGVVTSDPKRLPRPVEAKLKQGAVASDVPEVAQDVPKLRAPLPKRSATTLPATAGAVEVQDAAASPPLPLAAAATVAVAVPPGRQSTTTRAGETKIGRPEKSALNLQANDAVVVPDGASQTIVLPAHLISSHPVAATSDLPIPVSADTPANSAIPEPVTGAIGPTHEPTTTAASQIAEATADRGDAPPLDAASPPPFALSLPGQIATTSRPAAPLAESPIVKAQPGQLGHEIGVQIAHRVAAGGDELIVRLDPPTLGRIEVRMTFDDRASLRAVFTADSAPALDMLRRDGADLTRALSDAGIRSDAQTLRFDSRGGDSGGQPRHAWHKPDPRSGAFAGNEPATDTTELSYRNVRTSGRYDLMA